jgi:hypothetical protein
MPDIRASFRNSFVWSIMRASSFSLSLVLLQFKSCTTEDYTVGWSDVTNHLPTNISGNRAGSFFATMERWSALSDDLQALFRVCCEQSHGYRQWWYWGGEANLRVNVPKMELTSIPVEGWATIEAAAHVFCEKIAAESGVKLCVVDTLKKYNADMGNAGRPYRYT